MDNIIYRDGLGNQYNIEGSETVYFQIEVDNEMYLIENVTNSGSYTDLKPPEDINKGKHSFTRKSKKNTKVSYKHYKNVEKQQYLFLVKEKRRNAGAIALKLNINVRTTQGCVAKDVKDLQEFIQKSTSSETLA